MKNKHDPDTALRRKIIELSKLMNIYLNHFPRHEKYALCNIMRNTLYEIYDLISEGCKRYYKKTTLSSLDIAHERLRMQAYLAFELGYFNFKNGKEESENRGREKYGAIAILIDEVGKMIGGWIKKIKDDNKWN